MRGLRCPTCGYDRKADFDAYNLAQRRARHGYYLHPFDASVLLERRRIKDLVTGRRINGDTAREMRAEVDTWVTAGVE